MFKTHSPFSIMMRTLLGVLLLATSWMVLNTLISKQRKGSTDEAVSLTLSTWGNDSEQATLRTLLKQFEASHPRIQVTVRHMPEFYTQSLQMLLAANQSPDVMMLNSLDIKRFCQAGLLAPLQDQPNLEGFYPSALKSLALVDGTLCALPRDVSNLVMYINLDLLRQLPQPLQAKATPAWNMQDMEALATAATRPATQGQPQRWGLGVYQAPALFWLPYVWSEGGQWFNEETQTLQPDATAFNALARYKAYSQTLGIAPKRTQVASTTMTELFVQQRLLFLPSGRWSVPFLRENAPFQWDVLPFPHGKAGSRVGIDATGYAVSNRTPHSKEAQELLQFLVGATASNAWAQSGLIVPARRDVAKSSTFLQPSHSPRHSGVFLDAMATGVPSPYPPDWPSQGQRLNTAMDAYLNSPTVRLQDALIQAGITPPSLPNHPTGE
jgi:multiple sugar transport system substrate-binding protein